MKRWIREDVLPFVGSCVGFAAFVCAVWGHLFLPRWISWMIWGTLAVAAGALIVLLVVVAIKERRAVAKGIGVILAIAAVIAAMNGALFGVAWALGWDLHDTGAACEYYPGAGRYVDNSC